MIVIVLMLITERRSHVNIAVLVESVGNLALGQIVSAAQQQNTLIDGQQTDERVLRRCDFQLNVFCRLRLVNRRGELDLCFLNSYYEFLHFCMDM